MAGLSEQDLRRMDKDARQRSRAASKKESEQESCAKCVVTKDKNPAHQPKSKEQEQHCQDRPEESSGNMRPFWKKATPYRYRSNFARDIPVATLSDSMMYINAAALLEFGLTQSYNVCLFFDEEERKLALKIVDETSETDEELLGATKLKLCWRSKSRDMRVSIGGARNAFGINERGAFKITAEDAGVLVVHLGEEINE